MSKLINAVQGPYSKRIQDPEKAHAMALAGDELRTKARNCRLAKALMRQYLKEGRELDAAGGDWVELRIQTSKQLFEISPEDRWHEDEVYPDFSMDFDFSTWDNLYWGDDQVEKRWQENQRLMQPVFEKRGEEALKLDEEADALEYWAGIVHDSKVRDQYLKAHPNIDFSPGGLRNLHLYFREAVNQAREARDELRLFDDPGWMVSQMPRYLTYINWSGPDDAEIGVAVPKEVAELLNDESSTVGQLKSALKAHAASRANQTRQKARELAQIMSDISGGRAGS